MLKTQRRQTIAAADRLAGQAASGGLSDAEYLNLRGFQQDIRDANELLRTLPKVRVKREPLTYEQNSPHSFVQDLLVDAVTKRGVMPPSGAFGYRERLERHQREMDVIMAERRAKQMRRLDRMASRGELNYQIESRVAPSTTLGTGGEFTPPLWLIDRFSAAARAGRVLGDLMRPVPLPPGIASINIPKITSNETVGVQQSEGGVIVSTDFTTTSVSSPVATIAGNTDVSMQLLEQATPAGLDAFVFPDLTRDYSQRLEIELVNGPGTVGGFPAGPKRLLGVLNVPNSISVSYTDASPTGPKVMGAMGQAFGQMADSKLLPPEVILMAGRRFAWLAAALDGSGRPLMAVGHNPNPLDGAQLMGGTPPFGPMLGLPVYPDGALPLTLGTGANQDPIVFLRTSDMILFEGDPRLSIFVEVISGTLQARLHLHNYVAFVGARYPNSIATVLGTGLAAPAGY